MFVAKKIFRNEYRSLQIKGVHPHFQGVEIGEMFLDVPEIQEPLQDNPLHGPLDIPVQVGQFVVQGKTVMLSGPVLMTFVIFGKGLIN